MLGSVYMSGNEAEGGRVKAFTEEDIMRQQIRFRSIIMECGFPERIKIDEYTITKNTTKENGKTSIHYTMKRTV